MTTENQDRLSSTVAVKFSDKAEVAENAVNKEILAACVIQIANERNFEATRLRDAGKVDEAKKLLLFNADFLNLNFQKYGQVELQARCELNAAQAIQLEAPNWAENRKKMVEEQFGDAVQQTYRGTGKK